MSEMLGYAASCAVLATFLMRTMIPLRLVAILSNILFLGFGYIQNIHPVLFLHLALLPINVWRLLASRPSLGARLIATRKRLPNI
jgi:CRP/FNR family transcriptional regulator, cyclic AMP receptor protein